jgi:ADP-ribose pyrophosphatase
MEARCPKCLSTKIDQYRMMTGPIWCGECGFRIEKKEENNPFIKKDPVKILHEGNWLRLKARDNWEYVERVRGNEVINIIAIHNENLILVEQYRPALNARTIELPAGLVGDSNSTESFENAARRELLEETGFKAEYFTTFFRGPSSSGLTNEMVTFLFSDDLEKVEEGGGVKEEGENITVYEIPFNEVESFVLDRQMKHGNIISPRIFVALYFMRSFDDLNK